MILVGAGGHALELFDELNSLFPEIVKEGFFCYDQNPAKKDFKNEIEVLHTQEELKEVCSQSFQFSLGVGSSRIRKKVYDELVSLGGAFFPIQSKTSIISDSAAGEFDAMSQTFIGPEVKIGLGSLINVKANIHHECQLGDFVEIGPGALVLGNVSIGELTQIGAGAVILPGVKIGKNCKIGAGSVVTKDIPDGVVAYGVPCRIKE
jgi:sugar O-acyltransferase (sialic acid O-acetyltransferase NeuD family)